MLDLDYNDRAKRLFLDINEQLDEFERVVKVHPEIKPHKDELDESDEVEESSVHKDETHKVPHMKEDRGKKDFPNKVKPHQPLVPPVHVPVEEQPFTKPVHEKHDVRKDIKD